jgi:hypothetical protein
MEQENQLDMLMAQRLQMKSVQMHQVNCSSNNTYMKFDIKSEQHFVVRFFRCKKFLALPHGLHDPNIHMKSSDFFETEMLRKFTSEYLDLSGHHFEEEDERIANLPQPFCS